MVDFDPDERSWNSIYPAYINSKLAIQKGLVCNII